MTFGLNTTKNDFVFKDGTIVPSAEEHVVLGKTIDYPLTFYSHMKQLCKKVANKLDALARKKKLYGPFLWMGFNYLKARATSRRQFTFYH